MKPLARYAALHSYVELGHSLGLDPVALLRASGLDPAGMSTQDRWVPAAAVADLLERSALACGHEDFGLRLAEHRRLADLGPLSLVIRDEPDVRSALRVLSRHDHMYNEALRTRVVEHDGIATLRVSLDLGEPGSTRQAVELAVGVLHRLLCDFLGSAWQPVDIRFTHPAPRDLGTHRRVFGPHLAFEQDFNGIVVYTSDLDAPNAMSDPQLRRYARQLFGPPHESRSATTLDRVRELVELLLPTGRCSAEQIARSLGVDRRTVHRHLAAEGETFTSVLDATRSELAGHLVAGRRHTLTEIAELLAFSSPGNFTRWFRRRHGCTPTRWRTAGHTPAPPPTRGPHTGTAAPDQRPVSAIPHLHQPPRSTGSAPVAP